MYQHHLVCLHNKQENSALRAGAQRPVAAVTVLPSQRQGKQEQQPLLGCEVPRAALSKRLLPSVGGPVAQQPAIPASRLHPTSAACQSQGVATFKAEHETFCLAFGCFCFDLRGFLRRLYMNGRSTLYFAFWNYSHCSSKLQK